MLFYIPNNIIDVSNNKIITAINNLAFSRKQGYHLILSDLKGLETVKNNNLFDKTTRDVFKHLYNNYSLIGNLRKQMSFYIELSDKSSVIELKENNHQKIIVLSIDLIQDFDLLTKTKLLTENIQEIGFYIQICKYFKRKNPIFKNISLQYESLMGGGQNTCQVYELQQKNKKSICLCIVDSDKKYDNCHTGETLNSLLKIDDPVNLLCEIVSLNVCEVENLIPMSFLDEVTNDCNWKKGFKFIENLIKEGKIDVLKYLDFKEGLTLKKLENTKDTSLISFYNSFLDPNKKSDNVIIYGMGNKILDNVMQKVEFDDNKIELGLLKFQKDEWLRIGENFKLDCKSNSLSVM
ncbi:MAG: hypothetical protein U0354_19725 [Candidatus Sericytochromatia bacterium]